ncbi:hypothetical protein [Streptomyces sp. NPDC048584]|uniref:hypothetical protein n=1 Tax=Streptomyces sp. NPDC048584 TaxID=3365573 RepID=UPI0037139385
MRAGSGGRQPAASSSPWHKPGHLVYAKGNAGHAAHRVRQAGIILHQHALDLGQEPAGLVAAVEEVADRLTGTSRG